MTNPFDFGATEAHTDALAFDFPEFEAPVPAISRNATVSTGPRLPSDPQVAAVISWLISVPEKGNAAKVIGLTATGHKPTDDLTEALSSKVSLAARKWNIKVVRRTVAHPHDAAKPVNEQRRVIALWRGENIK